MTYTEIVNPSVHVPDFQRLAHLFRGAVRQRPGRIVDENLGYLRLRDALDLGHLGHGRGEDVAEPVAAELLEPVLGVDVVRHQDPVLRSLVAQLPGEEGGQRRVNICYRL